MPDCKSIMLDNAVKVRNVSQGGQTMCTYFLLSFVPKIFCKLSLCYTNFDPVFYACVLNK